MEVGSTTRVRGKSPSRNAMSRYLVAFGPGLAVMLADTDVGSVITAGQSGVQWGYRLLLLQLLLIPILYMSQELTVRLAIFTGRGHGELIREVFGPLWAWGSAAGLGVSTFGALLTEFSGVAGVGELYGLPRIATVPIAAGVLLAVVATGSCRRVEMVAIAIGMFEFAFFGIAWAAASHPRVIVAEALAMPLRDPAYLYLVAANVGAVISPWMIFYQQSATIDKQLKPEHLTAARWDTALGATLAQSVMAAVLVASAATIGASHPDASLSSVGQMSEALVPFLGAVLGRGVFGAGVLGAGMVAAIICSLAFAWGLGEVSGYRRSLRDRPMRAPWFHAVYAGCVSVGAGVVVVWPDLVALNVGVQVVNTLLLPLVLGLLIALAARALPVAHRLRGVYFIAVVGMATLVAGLGVVAGIFGTIM